MTSLFDIKMFVTSFVKTPACLDFFHSGLFVFFWVNTMMTSFLKKMDGARAHLIRSRLSEIACTVKLGPVATSKLRVCFLQ